MSKDFKNLINTVEKETKTLSELEAIINSLREENNRLKLTLQEQKLQIEDQESKISTSLSDLPSEFDILKEMILTQRKDLKQKDEKIENLYNKTDKLTIESNVFDEKTLTKQENNDLIEAQDLILTLSEENEQYINRLEELKNQLENRDREVTSSNEPYQKIGEENGDLINFKRLNFQLMEQNGLLRVEVESLKARIQKGIDEANSEELELANQKINILTLEIEDFEAQLRFLQGELEIKDEISSQIIEIPGQEESLKKEMLEYQKENIVLNPDLTDSKPIKIEPIDDRIITDSVIFNFPKQFQISLFTRMYTLLDDSKKKSVINSLIKDLNSNNYEIKRAALKILSVIKDKRVYDAFLNLVHDEDWLIRYNTIKALNQFDLAGDGFKELLETLSTDKDVDVRELVAKILQEISE